MLSLSCCAAGVSLRKFLPIPKIMGVILSFYTDFAGLDRGKCIKNVGKNTIFYMLKI
jgi:hypothetical protein